MYNLKKSIFVFLLVAGICWQGMAQLLPDTVIKKYNAAKTGREKVRPLMMYIFSIRDDSAFLTKATDLNNYFKSVNDQLAQDYIQLVLNDQLSRTGDYIIALASCFEILDRFEKKQDKFGILSAYRQLSTCYFYAGDKDKSIEYGKKAALLAGETNEMHYLSMIYNNLATAYVQNNMPDSALTNAQLAVRYAKETGVSVDLYGALSTLGESYIALRQYDKALALIRESYANNNRFDDVMLVWSLNDFAQVFLETNRLDSARYYAYKAIGVSVKSGYKDQLQRAYEYLSRSFEKEKIQDSAFKYLQLAMTTKDALYTAEKTTQLQALSAREQTRLQEMDKARIELNNKIKTYSLLSGLVILAIIAFFLFRNNRQKQKANQVLESTLSKLRATQAQLIQSEKMASLGELTAGIAHEIQNPLNFVNNFSEVNKELIGEMKEEIEKGNYDEVKTIAKDIEDNEEKINHHGKRADAIVKGMLQHSQSSNGIKEQTYINALCDEYFRLSYHGLRAKDKNFNATLNTDFDACIETINIIPQDIGRVLLNLYNNAFYAVIEKMKLNIDGYEPTLSVSTKKIGDKVLITVKDNGNGIPQKIVDKIFQPFFTTKPTGQGTGLGLSLSYDIIKAHDGEIKVETAEEGTTFIIQLPNS